MKRTISATLELGFDMSYFLSECFQLDLETTWILVCIAQASLRDGVSGRPSRRMVADKTGLPRETVRRRVADLIGRGLVIADENDRLAVAAERFERPEVMRRFRDINAAVNRYQERVESREAPLSEAPAAPPIWV